MPRREELLKIPVNPRLIRTIPISKDTRPGSGLRSRRVQYPVRRRDHPTIRRKIQQRLRYQCGTLTRTGCRMKVSSHFLGLALTSCLPGHRGRRRAAANPAPLDTLMEYGAEAEELDPRYAGADINISRKLLPEAQATTIEKSRAPKQASPPGRPPGRRLALPPGPPGGHGRQPGRRDGKPGRGHRGRARIIPATSGGSPCRLSSPWTPPPCSRSCRPRSGP